MTSVTTYLRYFIIMFVFLSFVSVMKSQSLEDDSTTTMPHKNYVWGNFGGGLAAGTSGFFTGNLLGTISFQVRNALYVSLRAMAGSGGFLGNDTEDSGVWELGSMIGVMNSTRYSVVSAAAGLSLGSVKNGVKYTSLSQVNIGIPVEAQAFIRNERAGFGLYMFGNINHKAPFIGLALAVQLVF